MKWQWSLLSTALFGSFALAQGTPEKLNSPKDSNPISLASPDSTLNSGNPILFPPEAAPETPSSRLSGNHNFDNFIGFLSNPIRNVDPRAMTEIYPLYGAAYFNGTPALPGGNFQAFGPGITVALSERLAVGLNDGGYAVADLNKGGNGFFQNRFGRVFNRLDFSGQREGWVDFGGFAQYTIIEDAPAQFLLTAGLYLETPTGSKAIFQGNGPANMAPYMTFGKEFGNYHILGTTGYQFPLGGGSSTSHVFFSNVHFDRKCFGWLYPLVEFNYNVSATSHDVSLPTRQGFINLGNFDTEGDTLTVSAGANAVIVKSKLEFGAVYTTSIASQSKFDVNAFLIKMVLRY
jgi:hypothetical protein